MPIQHYIYKYDITAGGGTELLSTTDLYTKYIIYSSTSATLVADMEFDVTGTPEEGMTFEIEYLGGVTSDYSGGTTLSFFGVDLKDAQAASRCKITAYYDGSTWNVNITPDLSTDQMNPVIWGYWLEDDSIDTAKIADGKVTFAKMADLSGQGYILRGGSGGAIEEHDASGSGKVLLGNGTDVNSTSISGDATLAGTGVLTIASNAITSAKINANAVTTGKLASELQYELITLEVSFETGELGDFKIKMPYAGTVSEIYAYATKAIAATDNGTITPKDNGGTTMTAGTITYTASDARGTAYSVTPSANNTFTAGQYLTFTTAKVTAGGKVTLSIKITRA